MPIRPTFRERVVENQITRDSTGADYGSAASEQNQLWFVRAQSWSEGHDTDYRAICDENDAQHQRWGTPYRDVGLPTVSNNADDPLADPANFHSNPGYLGTSTASSAIQSQPGSSRYRTPGPTGRHASSEGHRPMRVGGRPRSRTPGRTVLPAAGDRQPQSEGGPLSVTTGFPGR
jgi:hypothetical protein